MSAVKKHHDAFSIYIPCSHNVIQKLDNQTCENMLFLLKDQYGNCIEATAGEIVSDCEMLDGLPEAGVELIKSMIGKVNLLNVSGQND